MIRRLVVLVSFIVMLHSYNNLSLASDTTSKSFEAKVKMPCSCPVTDDIVKMTWIDGCVMGKLALVRQYSEEADMKAREVSLILSFTEDCHKEIKSVK